ncbi:helix-turn-helix domain-containing protein [Solitalea canadensis]|nr:helix-turn-helix transcriptional regulator [Solitalea canadensis]
MVKLFPKAIIVSLSWFFDQKIRNSKINQFIASMNETGYLIRKYRDEKRYSQEFIANSLEMGQSAFQKLESGETTLSFERLIKISILLEEPIDSFISSDSPYFDKFQRRERPIAKYFFEKEIEVRDKLINVLEKQIESLENSLIEKRRKLQDLYSKLATNER